MAPRNGELWRLTGPGDPVVLVFSGDMYNDLPDNPYICGLRVTDKPPHPPILVDIGDGRTVEVDSFRRIPKTMYAQRVGAIDTQAMTDARNAHFKVLVVN